jgi:predicted transposase YbfD/YdcC
MGCQKDIAQTIVSQEADDVLALKANHGALYDNVKLFLEDARAHGFQGLTHRSYDTVDADHGRLETRTYWITSALDWLGAQPAWANLQSIGMVESRREFDTTVETETRFSLISLRPDAAMFARAVRSHWHVENRLHWVLDVSFREDDCRIRNDQGPENFAVLRHIALNLLQREPRLWPISRRNRFNATWRNTAIFCAPSPWRMRQSSSRKLTSRTQWSEFSTPQCSRTALAKRAASHGSDVKKNRCSIETSSTTSRRDSTIPTLWIFAHEALIPRHSISDVIQYVRVSSRP